MTGLWDRVDALVAQAPDATTLRAHGLQLLGADLQRRNALPVDPALQAMERAAALTQLAVPSVLARIRDAVDGPLAIMRGPEAAASWARPRCRPFKDLDVIVPDAERAHAALLAAGFVASGACLPPEHHTHALAWPGLPLAIELHRALHPVEGLPTPTTETLLRLTRPSLLGVAGVEGLLPSAHAVTLASHAWAHGALEQIAPLIDIAAVLADADRAEADRLAREWGCERLWKTTTACVDGLLLERRRPVALRLWGRHLARARERSVLGSHVGQVLAPAWGLPAASAATGVGAALGRTALRHPGESWSEKRRRSRASLRLAGKPLSQYRSQLREEAWT
jgi:hypothetical protein